MGEKLEHREIPVNRGHFATVDIDDFDCLSKYTWTLSNGYATRRLPRLNNKQRDQKMHRLLMGEPGNQIDHINGNKLDNRRANLRHCSVAENRQNKPKRCDNKSGFKGVCWDKHKNLWLMQCKGSGRKIASLHTDLIEAARAYDMAAKELHGSFAWLNFQEGT